MCIFYLSSLLTKVLIFFSVHCSNETTEMKLLNNNSLIILFLLLILAFTELSSLEEGYSRDDFPPGFVFGSGTSAYQVEGAAEEDGRTRSIWDVFAHAGHSGGATGDVACDQYHKYKEDVKLMVEIGLDAYRFSISWSRLLPSGRGLVNPKGLQYYNNLIDELITHGIQPHVTLHHFDLPQVLEDEYGGWLSRESVRDFTAYADTCFKEFGDRVLHWTTINEVNVFALGGYDQGVTPPGRCSLPFGLNCSVGNSPTEPYIAVHNMLLAHASATNLYKKQYQVLLTSFLCLYALVSLSKNSISTSLHSISSTVPVLHPLVFGDYPETMKTRVGSRLLAFTEDESEQVKGAIDFVGVINYMALYVKDNSSSLKQSLHDFNIDMAVELTLVGNTSFNNEYANTPWSLQQVLLYIKENYGNPPIYIAENGQMTPQSSSLEDTTRIEYLSSHIEAGLHSLRYPKLSAHWYSSFLGGTLHHRSHALSSAI
ncbi:hypothetical protein IGI04_039269 [Brassica rapa subsp. trilocularis]|uniref:thioglucosidase n=1 Tax=Brassica rapa subsp. trilocularis TaxID=1813537 RepID=A0ABQ7KKF7_BRACM|nr:hypothetical protein IGI04_039269 [Brassica rapa subsp. trilocularis]